MVVCVVEGDGYASRNNKTFKKFKNVKRNNKLKFINGFNIFIQNSSLLKLPDHTDFLLQAFYVYFA